MFTASGLEEIKVLIQEPPVDALVICHTLEPKQQLAALADFKRYRPSAKGSF